MLDSTFMSQHQELSGFVRCKYPGKFCRQERARKRNGQLHRFCEEHRSRANHNQKRWSASRLRRWETLAQREGVGSDNEPRSPDQELELLAFTERDDGVECQLDSLQYPLQFIDNSALGNGFESSAELDCLLRDLFAANTHDAMSSQGLAYEQPWCV